MNSLAPTPQLAYAYLEQARIAINAYAQQEGYAVAIRRTRRIGNRKEGDVKLLILTTPDNTPCPYVQDLAIISRRAVELDSWRPKIGDWQVQVANGEHNHEPFTHKAAHPQGRYLTEPIRQSVLSLTRAGVKPSFTAAEQRCHGYGSRHIQPTQFRT